MSRSLFRRRGRAAPRPRREGAAAVEFAMVAAPFFFMIFAVLELGLVFLIDSTLENAVLSASRLVRTGQADTGNISAAQFKTALCAEMSAFQGDCASRAQVDVRVMPQFTDGIPDSPISNGVFNTGDLDYDRGQPGDLMLVRVWYTQPLVTPFMQQAMSRLNSGDAVISVATAFRNEPYRGSTP
ncbi:TadE/TadG family type IV pilus assembly protein [Brevundimonas sp.]|uniref:TadE/TadG family type IV pilus assembly protein n=1 Tax=Brevundimonas sp. TaxID=1871086 RepID=UPI0026229DEF|nr:TadE/TadG family type IV pilus assembly protein [Brevundimonas sp.]